MKNLAISCFALLLFVACSKYTSPTESKTSASGTIAVTVLDNTSKSGIANITVEARQSPAGAVVATAVTDKSGTCAFRLPPGAYWIDVVKPPGYVIVGLNADATVQTTVAAGGTTAITFGLSAS